MNEMLANYYFIIRNYCDAVPQLEEELYKNPHNKLIIKKLIICYTQTNKLQQALNLLTQLLKDGINIIIDTNHEFEDYPFTELIAQLESKALTGVDNLELYLELGILWLYCDRDESYKYFLKAFELDKSNKTLITIIDLLKISERSNHGKKAE
jgi:tetratricopeptide (TPR) repeat protein